MNREWAIEKLTAWIAAAEEYDKHSILEGAHRQALARRLLNLTPQAQEIVSRRYEAPSGLTLQIEEWDFMAVGHGITLARQTVARLQTEDETEEMLGTAAPRIKADELNSIVWDAAKSLWASGHYTEAVKRAATFLNAHVAALVDRNDVSDASLMREAFSSSPAAPGRPRLRWGGTDDSLTAKSMNDGLRSLAPGVYLAIRNVTTHDATDLSMQVAFEQLATLSLLARWIDECRVESGD
ncbi:MULTISPECIES: TIGR02391 family protein [unclassified Nocardioides]|uniref:TIGR02391 family protein n=1 Tax=unclassified Nocardioides TaxID=2615069 RepID=UPI00301461FF